jgi:hypothetical protein
MKVQMSNVVIILILGNCALCGSRDRSLMNPHRVGERAREQIVIALGHTREDIGK